MRSLILAALAAASLAAPALAERKVCHVSRYEDGVFSEVGAVLEPKFDRLLVETGPINRELKIAPDSEWQPLKDAAPGASFYIYWLGAEVPGKPWSQPGGLAYRIGGFAIQWPNFQSGGFRKTNFRTVIRMGAAASDRSFELKGAAYTMLSAQVLPLDKDMWSEWPRNWDHRIFFTDEWPAWIKELETGGKLTVDFYDGDDATPFATSQFDLPPLKVFAQRAIDDINDFRKHADPVKCQSGSRMPLP